MRGEYASGYTYAWWRCRDIRMREGRTLKNITKFRYPGTYAWWICIGIYLCVVKVSGYTYAWRKNFEKYNKVSLPRYLCVVKMYRDIPMRGGGVGIYICVVNMYRDIPMRGERTLKKITKFHYPGTYAWWICIGIYLCVVKVSGYTYAWWICIGIYLRVVVGTSA